MLWDFGLGSVLQMQTELATQGLMKAMQDYKAKVDLEASQRPCVSCGAALDGQCYVRAEKQPRTTEFVADGVWINQVEIEGVGIALPQHSHKFEHQTAVTKGGVRVEREDLESVEVWAPAIVTIPALVKHLFTTLSDEVILLCIHRIDRTGAVEIADEHHIVE